MSSLGVVSNGVVGLESDPLGQGSVLSRGLGQLGLGLEGLETLLLVLFKEGLFHDRVGHLASNISSETVFRLVPNSFDEFV